MGLFDKIGGMLNLNELKDQVLGLMEAKFELKKIELQEKAEEQIAAAFYKLIFVFLGFIILVLLSVWGALALNALIGYPFGFVLIILFYAFIILVVYLLRKSIAFKIREKLEQKIKL